MRLPFGHAETTFESFLQELPEDYWELAIEFKAFTRSRKIKTPAQLMQVVLCYCGLDEVLRETAGNFTLLEERISDTTRVDDGAEDERGIDFTLGVAPAHGAFLSEFQSTLGAGFPEINAMSQPVVTVSAFPQVLHSAGKNGLADATITTMKAKNERWM